MSGTLTVRRLIVVAAVLAGSLGLSTTTAGATSPHTLSELLADSWKYILETPMPEHPWNGGDPCIDLGDDHRGPVVSPSAPLFVPTLRCEVPSGTRLFVTVFTSECSNLETEAYDFGKNWSTGVQCALRVDSGISSVSLKVDGLDVPVHEVVARHIRFTNPVDDILVEQLRGPWGPSVCARLGGAARGAPTGTHTLELHSTGTYLGQPVDFTNTTTIVVT